MDIPFLLLFLLALPIAVAGIILAVSAGRRRSRAPAEGADEPEHRLQAGTAAAQDATPHPPAVAPKPLSARQRRAASGARQNRS